MWSRSFTEREGSQGYGSKKTNRILQEPTSAPEAFTPNCLLVRTMNFSKALLLTADGEATTSDPLGRFHSSTYVFGQRKPGLSRRVNKKIEEEPQTVVIS